MSIFNEHKMIDLERINVILDYFKPFIRSYYKDKSTPYDKLFSDYTREFHIKGVSRRSVTLWQGWDLGKDDDGKLQNGTKEIICDVFNLAPWIWYEDFKRGMSEMYKRMNEFIDINPKENIDEIVYLEDVRKELVEEEDKELNDLSNYKLIDLSKIDLNSYSPLFLHKLATKLKSKQQINDTLKVIDFILSQQTNYKYVHNNELKLLKAICYSHKSLKKWDEAIEVLRKLYGLGYHHINKEVITLLASNYKRKALTYDDGNWCKVEEINKELLHYSLVLYFKSMKMRKKQEKYYDAINIFYLLKIFEKVDKSYSSEDVKDKIEELNSIYHSTKFNIEKWWEVSTKAEFLMLNGFVDFSINEFKEHFSLEKNESFNIETTLRQIRMYINFTADKSAYEVLEFLEDVKKDIEYI